MTTISNAASKRWGINRELLSPAECEMRRRSFASEGRFGNAEPEGCASIREDAEVEVIFCCFSERDVMVYEQALKTAL